MSVETISHLFRRAFASCSGSAHPPTTGVTAQPSRLISRPSDGRGAPPSRAGLAQTRAEPAGAAREPQTTADNSAWQRLKAGVLRVALHTACIVVCLAALSVPMTWLLVGVVLLGVTVGHIVTALVDSNAARANAALAEAYA